jgi:hypothetical protein
LDIVESLELDCLLTPGLAKRLLRGGIIDAVLSHISFPESIATDTTSSMLKRKMQPLSILCNCLCANSLPSQGDEMEGYRRETITKITPLLQCLSRENLERTMYGNPIEFYAAAFAVAGIFNNIIMNGSVTVSTALVQHLYGDMYSDAASSEADLVPGSLMLLLQELWMLPAESWFDELIHRGLPDESSGPWWSNFTAIELREISTNGSQSVAAIFQLLYGQGNDHDFGMVGYAREREMVLTGKMKTDKNFLYPKRFCDRVCQSWAIARQFAGAVTREKADSTTCRTRRQRRRCRFVAQLSARCGRTPCTRS